ncbi:conserved hypothetical protein [Leishmania mexicana MHOM/GT/2001/U1103]|uniref:Uncharacterized protein n=1 Tax=Leishmania mexicana (strain MHOM/GT/2001/U1103) TaxID=929439 RepID=E9AMX0_LEIMU|nr:conserved hypothetical protein [Leishmania mexicana MHOM/GT/2001/U1103]CBZ24275.1 conserved hypothetical protein [Leishmania mexicana MHOM/GT/2001/U1103]
MNSRETSGAAAEPAPTPSSEPPRQRPADAVAVPASMQHFYTRFMTLLTQQGCCGPTTIAAAVSTSSAPLQHRSTSTTDGQDGTEDDALRRLTCVQEDALGPLLWQWLVLFSLAVQPTGAAPQERGAAPSAMAVATKVCSAAPSYTLGPHDVERLFRSGFSSLLPVAGSGGGAGDLRGSRLPPADPPAPWHSVPLAEHNGPERALVAALSALSCNGPLFSTWCALCYTCVGASLLVGTSQRYGEGGNATEDLSAAEEAIRSALRRLRHAWDSAVELADVATSGLGRPGTLAARRSVDACATLRLWASVYTTCTTSGLAAEAAPVTDEKGGEGRELQAPPLSLSLWAAQWYRECTRVAAHGADEGFHSEEAGLPVELVTRVMRYMCHRLEAEVVRRSRRHERMGSAASLTATVELEEVRAEPAAPLSTAPPSESNVPSPFRPTLRVGTLTALALQSPMHLVGDDAGRRGGRKGGAPLRCRRRARQMSADDDDDSDTDSSLENPDCGGGAEGSWSGRTDAQSGASRFILSQQDRFEVAIASGVFTTYFVCPADDNVAQPADRHYMHRLTGEQYLRNGTVHWWTLRDSQRHRQLMADARNASSGFAAQ